MICKLIDSGHTSRKLVRYIASKAVGMTADLGFGVMKFPKNKQAWAIDTLRACHGTSRASEVRHLVFSVAKGTPRKEARNLLRAVWADWIKAYAPDRPWVFAIQFHNGICHGHAAVANVDSAGKPLKFRPHQVMAMAAMKFTSAAGSGSGIGKAKGLPIYSRAKKLSVRDLATLMVDSSGVIRKEAWDQLEEQNLIKDFRQRKDGSLISFIYEGRRIRLSTLIRYVEHEQFMKTPPQPSPQVAIKPLSVQPSVSPKDLDAVTSALRSTAAVLQPSRSKKKQQTQQPNQPKL